MHTARNVTLYRGRVTKEHHDQKGCGVEERCEKWKRRERRRNATKLRAD